MLKMKIELDDYHYHEITDRLWMITDMLDEYVISHPVSLIDKKNKLRLEKTLQELLSITTSIHRKRDKYETFLDNGGKVIMLDDSVICSSNVKSKKHEVKRDDKATKPKVKVDDVDNKKKDGIN